MFTQLSRVSGLAALSACLATPAFGQSNDTKLVNLDTNYVAPMNSASARADVRVFGNDEKQTYGTIELNAGLQKGFGLVVRGTFSKFTNFTGPGFVIRHGGSDLEAQLKYVSPTFPNLSVSAGASLPNTPAQDKLFGTAQAIYEVPLNKASLYFGAKGVFRQDSTIVGISGGFAFRAAEGFELIGDVTGILSGETSYNTGSGNREHRAVYGLGIRYTPKTVGRQQFSLEGGITNGLGGSTGFSMTPALGNTVGAYFGASVRY